MRTDKERIQAGPVRKEVDLTKRPLPASRRNGLTPKTEAEMLPVTTFSEDEKHFCYWVLCNDRQIYHVLKRHRLSYPDSIENLDINRRNLLNRICRWFRNKKKEKFHIPSIRPAIRWTLDCTNTEKISWETILIFPSGLEKEKESSLPIPKVYSGTLCILLHPENRIIEIHALIKAKAKKQSKKENCFYPDRRSRQRDNREASSF